MGHRRELEREKVSTVAQLNPELGLRRGEALGFDAKRLLFEGSNGDYMPVGSQLGILLALSFRDDSGHHTTGSAALVGPGIAICATHVLEDQGFLKKLTNGGATLVAQAPLPGGMLLWTVTHVATVPDSDLAVLSMTLSSDFPLDRRFAVASITTRMPAVGEELTLTGLSAVRQTEEISRAMNIELLPGCIKGRVLEVYPEGRDRLLPSACLAVGCEARGGMSGGPVFDSRGFLVGAVTSAYPGANVSFVSHVWPALVRAQACPVWPVDPYPRPPAGTILQLGFKFGISIERPDAFEFCIHNNEPSLRYHAWQ
ncbi:serine protease [Variovorax sp. LjRoot290]|uniref:S1 family peptidase n=1 Tax=Variovorax sp. LjRoot290 TaxID=3342316 RepID=UPI003ED03600